MSDKPADQRAPEPRYQADTELEMFTDELCALLADEDLDEEKLQDASEGLLPKLHDAIRKHLRLERLAAAEPREGEPQSKPDYCFECDDTARCASAETCYAHHKGYPKRVADRPAASQRSAREEILKPSFCGVSGHFAFQQNGSSCLMCQRECRLVSIGLRLLRGGNVEFCDKAEIEAVKRVIEREAASQPPQELQGRKL